MLNASHRHESDYLHELYNTTNGGWTSSGSLSNHFRSHLRRFNGQIDQDLACTSRRRQDQHDVPRSCRLPFRLPVRYYHSLIRERQCVNSFIGSMCFACEYITIYSRRLPKVNDITMQLHSWRRPRWRLPRFNNQLHSLTFW
jgi:hypothetical protein